MFNIGESYSENVWFTIKSKNCYPRHILGDIIGSDDVYLYIKRNNCIVYKELLSTIEFASKRLVKDGKWA